MVYWGFSPDSANRTFAYAYVTNQSVVQWEVVNLQTHSDIRNETITSISAFWQFSPCGDVLGIVDQTSPNFIDVRLMNTKSNQADLHSETFDIFHPIEFRTTASSHILKIGTIDYTLSPNTANAVCTIVPISLKLTPRTVLGGFTSTGTVVLNNPADVGGRVVSLSSNNTGAATVLPSVTVPAGDTSSTFIVQTSSVASVQRAVISATAGGITQRDTLTVTPLSLASLMFSGTVLGGDSINATVTLTGSAGPGGKLVTLTNGNTSLVTIPAGVVVPEGSQSTTFTIHSVIITALDSVSISASAGGVVIPKTLIIIAFPTIGMQKDTVVGGDPATLIASLGAPAPVGGVFVHLLSSNDVVAHPNEPGVIGEGQTQASFYVQTTGVDTEVAVTISAPNAPFPTSTTLHVTPASLTSFTSLSDLGCVAGEQTGFTHKFIAGKPILFSMALDGQAPHNGALINLSSDKPGVLLLSDTLTIPYQYIQSTFVGVSASTVTTAERVLVAVRYRSVTLYDTITIIPAPHFTFVNLTDSIGLITHPVAINNSGIILGMGLHIGVATPVLVVDGNRQWLQGPPGYLFAVANGMNDSGVVVGSAINYGVDSLQHGIVWKSDTTIVLPELPGYAQGAANAINNHGDIVGVSDGRGNSVPDVPRACLWHDTTVTDLGIIPGDLYSIAADINGSREIVGTSLPHSVYDQPRHTRSFTWENTVLSLINSGKARAVNDSGEVVGDYENELNETGWYTYSPVDNQLTEIANLPPFFETEMKDINTSGVIVGNTWMYDDNSTPSAFIYISGFLFDLNCLTTLPAGYVLQSAVSINATGQIVGVVRFSDASTTREEAYLLNPVGVVTNVHQDKGRGRSLPTAYALSQNYPNPFNPATSIRYALPKTSHVTLMIYNLLGQVVATLVNEEKSAGIHEARWDAGRLSSGVYFYRLEATGIANLTKAFMQVKKMVVMK
jgi:probable HAF family extracellular repeat protein